MSFPSVPMQLKSFVGGGKSWRPGLAFEQGWMELPTVGLSTLRRPSSNALLKEEKKVQVFLCSHFVSTTHLDTLVAWLPHHHCRIHLSYQASQ